MSSGDDPVSAIITKIAAIERAMTPPSGASKAPIVFDEAPVSPGTFPCFINMPRRFVPTTRTAGTRERTEYVDIMLLFGRADERYSERAQRLWVPVVLDAFDNAIKLDTNVVQVAEITEGSYDPVEINDIPYIAVTFTLECQLAGAYSFGP